IYNIDNKGYMIGMSVKIKVVIRVGRWNQSVTHDGARKLTTGLKIICADIGKLLPHLYIYEGKAYLMGNHDYEELDLASFSISKTG
ncbi:hypothetical protein HOY82DRAFT_490321, partial [Tuber indicum]